MLIYIIGYIVSFIILYFIYKLFNDKFTYGMLAQIVLISILSWVGVVFEIIFILSILLIAFDTYLTEKGFWNKEVFKLWEKEIFKKK